MKVFARTLSKRVINFSFAFIVAFSSLTALMPFVFSASASAAGPAEIIYDALPSVDPDVNYTSLGYQATSTREFGDLVSFGGSNRILDTVTVTMSDWAKYSTYSGDAAYNSSSWSHPITLNVYKNNSGTPGALLATDTETFSIPWRPEGDPSCGSTSNGYGWKIDDVCYNYSGIAFDVAFDLSDLNVGLPSDAIVAVAYNTQTYGTAPIGVAGPYNSLNVAVPDNQPVSVGTDVNTDSLYWNSTYGGRALGLSVDSGWAPNGTVAFQITASKPNAPTNLHFTKDGGAAIAEGATVNFTGATLSWDTVAGAERYQIRVTDPNGASQSNRYTGWYTFDLNDATRYGYFGTTQGEWSYEVRTKDAASQTWSDWSDPVSLSYDSVKPVVSLTDPTTTVFNNETSLVINATDNLALNKVVANVYKVGVAGVYLPSQSSAGGNDNYDHMVSLSTLEDGDYYVKFNATDLAGNLAQTKTVYFTVDSTKPKIQNAALSEVVINSISANPTLTATLKDDLSGVTRAQYRITDATDSVVIGWTDLDAEDGAFDSGNETINSAIDLSSLTDGNYTLRLRAFDGADNRRAVVLNFTIDRTAPIVGILAQTSDSLTPTITGTVDDPTATVTVTINGVDYTATNNADGTWQYTVVTPLGEGTTIIDVTATDSFGNNATAVSTITVTLPDDGTEPPTTVVNEGTSDGGTDPVDNQVVFQNITTEDTTGDADVQGDNTDTESSSTNSDSDVKGEADKNTNAGTFLGLAWYWWLLIVAAAGVVLWWIISALRNRSQQDQ